MRIRSVREVRRLSGAQPQPAPPPTAHQIHEYLHLAAALGACPEPLSPTAQVTAAEVEQAGKAFLADLPRKTRSVAARLPLILGLHPGAEFGPAKRWPAERFAAVAREVCRRFASCVWLVFGGTKDRELCEEIARAAAANALNLAGRTSLRQLMALLKLCRVLLTNDTGPMHLAAALGTPVVVPFGSTSPELTGPGLPGDQRQHHRLLSSRAGCAPCFRRACPIDFRCMTGLSVGAVTEAVLGVV
jgi:heptosyltransferase-2